MTQVPPMIPLSRDRRAVLISARNGLVRFEVQEAIRGLGHTALLEWCTLEVRTCSLLEWLAARPR